MRPSTPQGWAAVNNAYRAVKDYPLPDQVVAAAWCLTAALSAMRQRERELPRPGGQAAFERACDEALAYVQREIAALRFTKR